MKTIRYILILSIMFLLTGCPTAEITTTIISTQITGSANDGDSTTPADNYGPAGVDLDAEDSKTKASSVAAKFNEVGGKAKAETLNPGGQTIVEDLAVGKSFNKVVSEFKVTKAGNFAFDITINAKKIELVGDGKVNINVQANILNNDGTGFPNGGITNMTFESKLNQAGAKEIIIDGDANNPDHPDANGDYNRTISGPNGGIQMPIGTYRLEFDLRIIASAPTSQGPNNQAHSASVENVTAKIELR